MGSIIDINGPLVTAELPGVANGEQVRLGAIGVTGEVIAREGEQAVVQVYEATDGIRPGETVEALGHPLSVELGPGLLGQIFDGVQRPLEAIRGEHGDHIPRGVVMSALDRDARWSFTPEPELAEGQNVTGGQVLGSVPETGQIQHRIMVPPDVGGELTGLVEASELGVDGVVAWVRDASGSDHPVYMHQRWPVRRPRPYGDRQSASEPLITGQRILDTFFPLVKGGKGAVPGPFGAGKTMVQQQIARWANADIVIYVGCGERGNELVDILESFPELTDPYSGRSLMERTLLVANTSNMPVVAREASIYVGVTMAEYYRDQGFDVVMVADSTSRWAEALREVAGRLGQMPVEEGYPAYLASRLAALYERAGSMRTLANTMGSVTLIGAVSPPGGDFSEPVTSHTKEMVPTFWALSKPLADARHYPAVSWTESYSGYVPEAAQWWAEQVDSRWESERARALSLLAEAEELERIVSLVGAEALSPQQRWTLSSASLIKEGVLQQSALEETDTFASPAKQFALLNLVLEVHDQGRTLLEQGVPVQQLLGMSEVSRARRAKELYSSEQVDQIRAMETEVREAFDRVRVEYAQAEGSA